MKYVSLIALFAFFSISAQVTTSKKIEGAIVKPMTVSFNDLKSFPSQKRDSVVIINHKMERKSSLKQLKGLLLKDVLDKVEFSVNSPKILSEFYLVCIADDGTKWSTPGMNCLTARKC